MAAEVLTEECLGTPFAIVATFADDMRAVYHVGILASEVDPASGLPGPCRVSPGEEVDVFHSGPPLEVGQPSEHGSIVGRQIAHILINVTLSEPEAQLVQKELDYLRTAVAPHRKLEDHERLMNYIAFPHEQNTTAGLRLSCAGFVMRAFRDVFGDVLDISAVPMVSLTALQRIWPRFLADSAARTQMGLGGHDDASWNVVLPGYVVHAFDRMPLTAPYAPKAGDEYFPHQASSGVTLFAEG